MRDPVLNALSILQCYRSGNYEWFSVLPPNMPPLLYKTATDIQKSVYQVFFLHKILDSCEDQIVIHHLSYERLCHNPTVELSRLGSTISSLNSFVSDHQCLPDSFDTRSINDYSSSDVDSVISLFRSLVDIHGPLKYYDL